MYILKGFFNNNNRTCRGQQWKQGEQLRIIAENWREINMVQTELKSEYFNWNQGEVFEFCTSLSVYLYHILNVKPIVAQLLSCVWLFATPWTPACKASLSFTISLSLLKLMPIESMILASHLILCRPLLLMPSIFSSIRVFSDKLSLHSRCQNIGASASVSVLLMNIQSWFLSGLTSSISLQSIKIECCIWESHY